jgi:hypothetical protein
MEYQARDSISGAIDRWRQELALQAGLTAEIRRELEAHLCDCMAAFRKRGLSDEESFRLARQRVGRPQQLNKEFNKAMKPTVSLWNRPLIITAWAMYIVSFFLPSYAELYGWKCALMQLTFWPQAVQGDWVSIHYELLMLANLLMLASPFLLGQFSQSLRHLQWLHHMTLAAVILVWSFVLSLLLHQDGAALKAGCFVWSLSFALLYIAVLVQLIEARRQTSAGHA